jgi:hypothetical protein
MDIPKYAFAFLPVELTKTGFIKSTFQVYFLIKVQNPCFLVLKTNQELKLMHLEHRIGFNT